MAGDGRAGLSQLAERQFDLVIVDLAMPDIDGWGLLELAHARGLLASVPVVMLTASGMDEDRADARAKGVDAFLTKPASSWELLETVDRLLADE